MSADQVPAAKPKLRWYQFSLRSLFLVTILVAVVSSWFAVKMGQAKRQREAVETLKRLGNIVVLYDYQEDSSNRIIQNAELPGPSWLRKLLGDDFFINATFLNLANARITDDDLEYLKAMNHLKELNLAYDHEITDAGIEKLKEFKQLKILTLDGTQVTDAGLQHLAELKQLKTLSLGFAPDVTNEGVEKLKKELPNVEILIVRF